MCRALRWVGFKLCQLTAGVRWRNLSSSRIAASTPSKWSMKLPCVRSAPRGSQIISHIVQSRHIWSNGHFEGPIDQDVMEAWTHLTAEFRERATQSTYGVFESFMCIRQKNKSTCKHCFMSHETDESALTIYDLAFDKAHTPDNKFILERLFTESL